MKRAASILLTMLLVATLSLIGCGQPNDATTTDSGAGANTSAASGEAQESSGAPAEGAGGEEVANAEGEEYVLKYVTCHVGADPSAAATKEIVDEFNELHKGKIRVEIDGVPEYTNMINKIKTNIAGGYPIDIMYYKDVVTSPGFFGEGQFADLTPYIDDEFKSYFNDTDWNECTDMSDKVISVPYSNLVTAIYYNKELFAAAGIDEASLPFKDWDEFFAACDKLKAAGITPISQQTAGGNSWCSMLMYSAYVGSDAGPDIMKGLDNFDDPAFLEAAELLYKLRDYTTPDALNGQYQIAANNFTQERTAMIPNGPWMLDTIKEAPGLYEKIGIIPFPGVVGGEGPILTAGPIGKLSSSIQNESDPGRMEAIVEFMKFHMSPENAKKLVQTSNTMYCGKLEWSDSDNLDPILKDYYYWLDEVPWTINEIAAGTNAACGPAFDEEACKLWMDEITPQEFVDNLEKKTFGG